MEKGKEPVLNKMRVDTPAVQVVGMDVDFADPTGKVFKSTYFEFDLARKNGYFEAGEYICTLTGPDGEVGVGQKITLKGENPVVYRGAMDFTGSDGKGGKIQAVSSGLDAGPKTAQNDTPTAAPTATDIAPVGSAPDMVPQGAFNKTADEESVTDHPKGCGCAIPGIDPAGALAALSCGAIAVTAVAVRRRRRK
jgi:hypothetical protein